MKKFVLAGALLVAMAAAAQAQASFEYERRTRNWSLRVTYSSPYVFGYDYYSCSPFGFGGVGYGTYGGWSYGYPGGSAFNPYAGGVYYNYWNGPLAPIYPGYVRPAMIDTSPPVRARGTADRSPELLVSKNIDEGRRRFRAADYHGAVAEFREAVAADTASASAQAYFALALGAVGDFRNADKSLRGAVQQGAVPKIALKEMFRDDKERSKVLAVLGKAPADASLTPAYAHALLGDPDRLTKLAEKDSAAKKLLGP